MFDPFLIPLWIELDVIVMLGDRKKDGVDLTKHWLKILLKHVCAWQRDTFDWCTNDNDLTSMELFKEFSPTPVTLIL